jgi:hypothetical protein
VIAVPPAALLAGWGLMHLLRCRRAAVHALVVALLIVSPIATAMRHVGRRGAPVDLQPLRAAAASLPAGRILAVEGTPSLLLYAADRRGWACDSLDDARLILRTRAPLALLVDETYPGVDRLLADLAVGHPIARTPQGALYRLPPP